MTVVQREQGSVRTSDEGTGAEGFASFGLHQDLQRAVADLGFTRPTPIQAQAIPPALEGRDVLGCAMTGSGKTAAFLLPILHRLIGKPRGRTRVLILAPTRELAAQIEEQLQQLAKHTGLIGASVFGGVGMKPQEQAFRRGVDFIVATPGRLLDHFQYDYARLDSIEYLVIDEADRMLDMGFLPTIRKVLRHLPKTPRQTLFFSATMPPAIADLSAEMLKNAVRIDVERRQAPATGVTQAFYPVPQDLKVDLLVELLRRREIGNVIVFCRTKHRANRLAEKLEKRGIDAAKIHGNRSQNQRTEALADFKAGRVQVLVATDIVARGIDVEELDHVVNFDVPAQPEDYIHRVGRTARAEATGDAFTFVSPEEEGDIRNIERAVGRRIERRVVDGFDYTRRTPEAFEIPIGQRIAEIRARKSEERARAKAKADRKAQLQPGQQARPGDRTSGASDGTRQGPGSAQNGASRGGSAGRRGGRGPGRSGSGGR